jgi:hypothetical protein
VNAGSPCMPGMLEVKGTYCTDVKHRCVKGGRTHTQEETEEPEPYYCDAYLPGYAQCLDKEEPKHFCIDQYEYPNQAGTVPMVMVTWYEARRLCEAQNKRLCGDDEWTLACEGPERFPYPHGWARDRSACNIDHLWIQPNDGILASHTASPSQIQAEINRLSKRVPSGSMPRCKSPYGVMDMTGNVDEWTVNVSLDGKPYASAFKGGHWISGARNRCRAVTVSHDENTYYYSEGFRCCANPGTAAPQGTSTLDSAQPPSNSERPAPSEMPGPTRVIPPPSATVALPPSRVSPPQRPSQRQRQHPNTVTGVEASGSDAGTGVGSGGAPVVPPVPTGNFPQ